MLPNSNILPILKATCVLASKNDFQRVVASSSPEAGDPIWRWGLFCTLHPQPWMTLKWGAAAYLRTAIRHIDASQSWAPNLPLHRGRIAVWGTWPTNENSGEQGEGRHSMLVHKLKLCCSDDWIQKAFKFCFLSTDQSAMVTHPWSVFVNLGFQLTTNLAGQQVARKVNTLPNAERGELCDEVLDLLIHSMEE